MSPIIRIFTPQSQLGPLVGGMLAVAVFGLLVSIVAPPAMWLAHFALGPWWAYWSF